MRKSIMRKRLVRLSLSVVVVGVLGGAPVASGSAKRLHAHAASATTIRPSSPTFVGPAATGCKKGCSLLSGPFVTTSTTTLASVNPTAGSNAAAVFSGAHAMPAITPRSLAGASSRAAAPAAAAPTPIIPVVRCEPIGAGCDNISTSPGARSA